MKRSLLFCLATLLFWGPLAWAAGPDAASALSGGAESCYRKAEPGTVLSVPADLFPHEDFRTEWWYVTGNLEGESGEHYGYQFTIFRRGLACDADEAGLSWSARHLYFAHLAVSSESEKSFHTGYRMERQSFGLSGWQKEPLRIWVADVSFGWDAGFIHLATRHGEPGFSLTLESVKPPVLQGEAGFSVKDPASGSASHYLTLSRLKTDGTLSLPGRVVKVAGVSWMDREWSTGSLGSDQSGWDWLALHLDDGRDLMVCRVRGTKAAPDYYFGSISLADGSYRVLGMGEFTMVPNGGLSAPSGREYPGTWTVSVPREAIALTVTPLFDNQEHGEGVVYWEGAVKATGKGGSGRGYLEMTGY